MIYINQPHYSLVLKVQPMHLLRHFKIQLLFWYLKKHFNSMLILVLGMFGLVFAYNDQDFTNNSDAKGLHLRLVNLVLLQNSSGCGQPDPKSSWVLCNPHDLQAYISEGPICITQQQIKLILHINLLIISSNYFNKYAKFITFSFL